MAGARGYPLQETFIKTLCFCFFFALLTLGYNSTVHHGKSENHSGSWMDPPPGCAVTNQQKAARGRVSQAAKSGQIPCSGYVQGSDTSVLQLSSAASLS